VALASVIGRDFDFALLDRAAALGAHAAAEAVEELVARRLLHVVGERLDFTRQRLHRIEVPRPGPTTTQNPAAQWLQLDRRPGARETAASMASRRSREASLMDGERNFVPGMFVRSIVISPWC